jgi:transcription antitermination factor NusG
MQVTLPMGLQSPRNGGRIALPTEETCFAADPWYVVQTKPHKEALVEHVLHGMASEVFCPRIVVRVRAGLRVQRRVTAMFPSYLFARLRIDSAGKAIRYSRGVRDFVRCGGSPQVVAPDIVAALQARTWPTGVYEPPPIRFNPGERLEINEGPLRGLAVVFEREMNGPERVAVLLAEVCLAARVILGSEALSRA